LAFLLVLTAGDYLLWHWSIANGHDIMSLVAGLTLLPLAALSLGGVALASVRLPGWLLGRSSPTSRAKRASRNAPREQPQHASSAEADSSSGRLAA
jgi:hypothetical protein